MNDAGWWMGDGKAAMAWKGVYLDGMSYYWVRMLGGRR